MTPARGCGDSDSERHGAQLQAVVRWRSKDGPDLVSNMQRSSMACARTDCRLGGAMHSRRGPTAGADGPEGIWQGYDGEWEHVSSQLIALAEATPAEKFAWRPAPGVRSTSEVYMHIVEANFYLLSVTGPKMPADMIDGMEKTVSSKADVIRWLRRSLDTVKQAHLKETPEHLARKVKIEGQDSTVDWMYLRIIIHANEHMGQLVAYARMTGVVPPWSK
jgi:uncharacterized damage-inducible protein DinB